MTKPIPISAVACDALTRPTAEAFLGNTAFGRSEPDACHYETDVENVPAHQLALTLYAGPSALQRFFQEALQRIERGEYNKQTNVEHFEHLRVTRLPQWVGKAFCFLGSNGNAYQAEVWVARGTGGFQLKEEQYGEVPTCASLEAVARKVNKRLEN